MDSVAMEDEFDSMYSDELEVLRELEGETQSECERRGKRSRIEEPQREITKKAKLDVVKKLFVEDQPSVESSLINDLQKRVLKRIPAGNFMPVTCPETKKRVYLRIRSQNITKTRFDTNRIKDFVSTSFEILRQQAEEIRERTETRQNIVNRENICDQLWVEQFKPRNFIDLLSDDGINRNLLRWLKLWDKIVFNRQPRSENKIKIPPQKQNSPNKKFPSQIIQDFDATGCPVQRLALLCGPPGLGKTTLAHVIAIHAGYNVVELNASDDRSPDQFRRQIEAATQMRSVIDQRPNCLVIDEIDGAPVASINLMLSMTTESERKGKKKNCTNALKRPIICICNDQYVPALRQLRRSALVLQFPPIAATRLAFRLQDILNLQKYILDLSSILALCKKTGNDVRSCLSTLQFVFGRSKSKSASLATVLSSAIGIKDAQKSHFNLWQDIFYSDLKDTNDETRFDRIVRTSQATGDYDKIYQGIFENYLTAKSKHLNDICKINDWFEFVDCVHSRVYDSQNFVLMSYLPVACAYFHAALSSNSPSKVEFPIAQIEVRNKTSANENLLETLNQDRPPKVRSLSTRNSSLLDVLPFLSTILRPPLRPVNTRLLSTRERTDLESLVNLMVSLNLSFVQKKSTDGQYTFDLEPNLDDLVRFATNSQNLSTLTYAAKQLVSREVELEKVRRIEKNHTQSITREPLTNPTPKSVDLMITEKNVNLIDRKSVDFFGRFVPQKIVSPSAKTESVASTDRAQLWFRFKEGFSNAVRRNVRIGDFL